MKLGTVLRKYRLMSEMTIRDLAKEIGTSAATLMRVEQGYNLDFKTFKKILDWLSRAQ